MEKTILAIGMMMLLGATLYMTTNQSTEDYDVVALYGQWKLKHNKKSTNQNEDWYRLRVFMESVQHIRSFYESKEEFTYTLELNQFADMTDEEFAQTYLNLVVPEHKQRKNTTKSTGAVPNAAVDWEKAGKVPAVKNQGGCGSCWAFSAVAAMESNSRIVNNKVVDLAEQDLVECAGSYGNYGCNGGWMDYAFEYVIDNGIANGADYTYTATDSANCKRTVARDFHIKSYQDVDGCDDLKEQIQKGTVSVAVDASNWKFYSSGVFKNCAANLNHGVQLVGVDELGTWKIRNSWSAGWGESGYIKLASGDTCGICSAASFPQF